MLLTIDIGNTNMTLGLYQGESLAHAGGWQPSTSACPMNTACSSWACSRTPGSQPDEIERDLPGLGRAAADRKDRGGLPAST